jgi:hypothetical protein
MGMLGYNMETNDQYDSPRAGRNFTILPSESQRPANVSEWDWNRVSAFGLIQIQQYKMDWDAAKARGDTRAMMEAHERAEDVRNRYRKPYEYGTGNGDTVINIAAANAYRRQPQQLPPKVEMENRQDDFTPFGFQFSSDAPVNSSQHAGRIYISGVDTIIQINGIMSVQGNFGDELELRIVLSDSFGIRRYISSMRTVKVENLVALGEIAWSENFDLAGLNLDGEYFNVQIEKVSGSASFLFAGHMSGRRVRRN